MSISLDSISSYLDTAKSTNSSSNVEKTLKSDLSTASEDEMMDACKEFETYFIEQVLKEVEKTIPQDEDSSMSKLTDFYKDQTMETIAEKIGEQSGNNFAQTLYEQMKRNYGL